MWRLVKISLISVAVLSIIVSVLLIGAQRQPLSATFQNLQLTDCGGPCLLGIKLNQTTADAAGQRILKLFGDSITPMPSLDNTELWVKKLRPSGAVTGISITFEKNIVRDIEIETDSTDSSTPTLGEILSTLGPPDCVYQYNRSLSILLIYQKGFDSDTMLIVVNGLTLTRPINGIRVTALSPVTCTTEFTLPWRGLHSRTLYRAGN